MSVRRLLYFIQSAPTALAVRRSVVRGCLFVLTGFGTAVDLSLFFLLHNLACVWWTAASQNSCAEHFVYNASGAETNCVVELTLPKDNRSVSLRALSFRRRVSCSIRNIPS